MTRTGKKKKKDSPLYLFNFEVWHCYQRLSYHLYGSDAAILMVCVTKVAKSSLDKALAENPEVESILVTPQLPMVSTPDLHQPLIIKIDRSTDEHKS